MRKFVICLFVIIAQVSICYGQDATAVFEKYKNLTDRNYRDISISIKPDIDSLLVCRIDNTKEKHAYIKDFKNRLKGIDAFLIPNNGLKNSIDSVFSNMEGYKRYQLENIDFTHEENKLQLDGPLKKSMIFDRVYYYLNNDNTSFIMIIEKYDVTYFTHLKGIINDQDVQRIVYSTELSIIISDKYQPAW